MGRELFGVGECSTRPIVFALWLDIFEKAGDCFDVVIEDIWLCIHDNIEGFETAFKIGDEDFGGGFW